MSQAAWKPEEHFQQSLPAMCPNRQSRVDRSAATVTNDGEQSQKYMLRIQQ